MRNGLEEILFAGGDQPVRHLPPLRVASATYAIEDLFESESSPDRIIQEPTAATVHAYATATTADAGVGTTRPGVIEVAAAAGIEPGDHVQVSSANGREVHRVADVTDGMLHLAGELGAYHPEGAAVEGVDLSGTFPADAASNETLLFEDRPLRVLWTYTLDGHTYRAVEQARVVRFRFRDQSLAAVEQAVRDAYPTLVLHLRQGSHSLRDLVRVAVQQLQVRLNARQVETGGFMPGSWGHELAVAKVLEVVALNGIFPNGFDAQTFLAEARAEFAHVWRDLSGQAPKNVVDVHRETDTADRPHSIKLRNPTLRP